MKNSFILFILCIFMFSCATENMSNEISTNIEEVNLSNRTAEADLFKPRLKWVSYITAKVLYRNLDLRDDFISLIDENNNVNLNDLFATDLSDNNNLFKIEFTEELRAEIMFGDGKPGDQSHRPPSPVAGDPDTDTETETGNHMFDDLYIESVNERITRFYDYILLEHCLEINVPNSLDFSDSRSIVSVGHPLNDGSDARGFLHQPNPEAPAYSYAVKVIYPTFVHHNNVLITRPYRPQSLLDECSYIEYEEIDFTLFPNN